MATAPTFKQCVICGQDCSQRPRTRDSHGRYACVACVEAAAKARAQKNAGTGPEATRLVADPEIEPIFSAAELELLQNTPVGAPIAAPPAAAAVATPMVVRGSPGRARLADAPGAGPARAQRPSTPTAAAPPSRAELSDGHKTAAVVISTVLLLLLVVPPVLELVMTLSSGYRGAFLVLAMGLWLLTIPAVLLLSFIIALVEQRWVWAAVTFFVPGGFVAFAYAGTKNAYVRRLMSAVIAAGFAMVAMTIVAYKRSADIVERLPMGAGLLLEHSTPESPETIGK